MGQDESVLTIDNPANAAAQNLDKFCDIVAAAGEVRAKGLLERLKRAEALAFLYCGPKLIAVGALKRQHPNYTQRVFEKAQARNQAKDFSLELGWIVVCKGHRGKRYSERIVEGLLSRANGKPVYATSVTTNIPMHKALAKHKFERDGLEWQSQERKDKQLLLFVRSGGS